MTPREASQICTACEGRGWKVVSQRGQGQLSSNESSAAFEVRPCLDCHEESVSGTQTLLEIPMISDNPRE